MTAGLAGGAATGVQGYLCLVLHAHLPFVRHPEHERFLEEVWLFEALTETYLPLLRVFERLLAAGIRYRLTLSLSPTLVAMLRDPLLQGRYLSHLARLERLAEQEQARTRGQPQLRSLARWYAAVVRHSAAAFESYGRDPTTGFQALQRAGVVELITCAATHAYLPLLRATPEAVRAQVQVAAETHTRVFGTPAPGIWLPECGYYPGLEETLAEAGFAYFMLDSHGILGADTPPRYGTAAPLACPNGVAAFGRDPSASHQVWSARSGYPGHGDYREFHRDIGLELEADDLAPYWRPGEPRLPTGFKYHRVTGHGSEPKRPYRRPRALRRCDRHAAHFLAARRRQAAQWAPHMDRPPLALAPYDAELFGHWWYEGPQWLERLIRRTHAQRRIEMLTPSDYLRRHPRLQCAQPAASSWGLQGYHRFWLNERNAWIYPQLHEAAVGLRSLLRERPDALRSSLAARALAQAGRSLLLAQASDWAFMMQAGPSADYARDRARQQLARCRYLQGAVREGSLDRPTLGALEAMDNLFPELDPRVFG